MPDRTGIFLGWSANLSNFLGLGVEAGASPMYPQKMRVPPPLGVIIHMMYRFVVGGELWTVNKNIQPELVSNPDHRGGNQAS